MERRPQTDHTPLLAIYSLQAARTHLLVMVEGQGPDGPAAKALNRVNAAIDLIDFTIIPER